MKVLDLACSHGHGFEGWFGSEDAYRDQAARGLVTCPVCGDAQVVKRPSAPRLNLSHARATAAPAAVPASAPGSGDGSKADAGTAGSRELAEKSHGELASLQAAWWRAAREAVRSAENVGDRFADEARRIHHGQAEERCIRGQATREDAQALREEGIGVVPVPDGLDETLQ